MRKRLVRWSLYLCVLLSVLYLGACQILDRQMYSADDGGLLRLSAATDTQWTISYLSSNNPSAPRVIYVHGTPGSAGNFDDYISDPVGGWEAISIDRPGFGQTSPRKPALTLAEQAKVLEPFLAERDGRWPILVGHSMGGPIIAQTAVDFPDKVGGLVILAGALDPDLEKVRWYQHVANFAFFPYIIPRALRNANREVLPLRDELVALGPRLKETRCPVIIIHARDDSLVPFENASYMQAAFPEDKVVDLVELDNKNHFLPWNSVQTVRQAVERLILNPQEPK